MFDKLFAMLGAALQRDARPAYNKFRPTGAALRNPADPIQAARIEAAAVKRARRADKLHHQAQHSSMRNPTIVTLGRYGALESFRKQLFLTYTAK